MKSALTLIGCVCVAAVLSPQHLHSQAAPPPPAASSSAGADEAIKLSPFVISADSDVGFVATSALAGGRLNTPLKDTPVAYSVLTKEFMDAFNITDLTEAAQWSVNTNYNPGNNTDQGFGFSPAINISMRGASPSESNYPMRNFFPINTVTDSYALDRFDFARGPNAVLFGAAQFGGTPSATTKQAILNKESRELRLQAGSWQKVRATADVNTPLGRNAALRIAGLGESSNTWRDDEWRRKKAVFITSTYRLTPATTLRADGEYSEAAALIFPTALLDQVSAWDGKTTFTGAVLPANAPSAAQQAASGIAYGTNNANPQLSPLWVYDPTAFGTGNVLNFANMFRTKGAAGNATAANRNLINGRAIVSGSVSYAGQPMLYGYDVPTDRYVNALAGSPYFQVPSASSTNLWSSAKPSQAQVARDFALTLNHKITDSLFFEVAGDTNKVTIDGNNAVNRGLNTVYIDINQTLPNGAPNPNFKHPYSEFWTYGTRRWYELRSLRAGLAYVKDLRFAKVQLGLIGGANFQRQEKRSLIYLLPLANIGPDARYWTAAQTSTALWNRLYLDQGGRDFYSTNLGALTLSNPDGTTTSVTPTAMFDPTRKDNNAANLTRFKFVQTAGNLSFFQNRLIIMAAARRDLTDLATLNIPNAGDLPAGWDGRTFMTKPNAPKDWATLTYIPKDATGKPTGPAQPADSRPRLSVPATSSLAASSILPQPQYAQDRFRDDYNPPALHAAANTFSVGGTFNVLRWLGVFGNASTSFNPNLLVQRLDGSLLSPTDAHGTDYGIRINPPGGRLSLSIGAFNSYQKNSPASPPSGVIGSYNTIYSTPVAGDLSSSSGNPKSPGLLPTVARDTLTFQSHGIEVEFTANLNRSWRILANGAYTRAWQSDAFPDTLNYAKSHEALVRQILADAGVLINSANTASINPAVNDPAKINVGAVTNAVNAWNTLQNSVFPNIVSGRQKLAGAVEQTANAGFDYTFREGRLTGFTAGLGFHYRGRMVVGYRGADSIVNPANPTTAIDDPSVDAYTTVFTKPYTTLDARFAYKLTLANRRVVDLTLNITNLSNRRTPVFFLDPPGGQSTNTVLRPRGADITSPALETVPGGYSWLAPIGFTLGANLRF